MRLDDGKVLGEADGIELPVGTSLGSDERSPLGLELGFRLDEGAEEGCDDGIEDPVGTADG